MIKNKFKLSGLTIYFTLLTVSAYTQPLPYDQNKVDSLNKLIVTTPDDTNKVNSLIFLAQMYMANGNTELLLKYITEAESISKKLNYNEGIISSKFQKAFYYSTTGDWPKGILGVNELIPLLEKYSKKDLIGAYNLMFINTATQGHLDEAKMWVLKALNSPEFPNLPDMTKWPTYMQAGLAYEFTNNLDSAQYYANILQGFLKKYHHQDLENNSYNLLGSIARKKKQYDIAKEFYNKAVPVDYLGLAWVYDELKKKDSVIYYAKASLSDGEKVHDPRKILESSKLLAKYYADQNPALSNKYLQLYSDTKDSLFNSNKLKQLEEIGLTEQRKAYESQQEKTIYRNRLIQFGLVGLALLFLFATLVFYFNSKFKKRANEKLEAQNRELEIEAALERVRAVAMSMTKPDDLLSICETMYHELKKLGFADLRNAMINIHYDEKSYLLNYDFAENTGRTVTSFAYNSHPIVDNIIQHAKQSFDSFTEMIYSGKKLDDLRAFRKNNGEADDPRLDSIDSLCYYFYSTGTGAVGISMFNTASQEQLNVLKRFRNVFDLAYKRYVDITKAEAQAREAKIEAALEKVRSRSLAMHKSEELGDVVLTLQERLNELGIQPDSININIAKEHEKAFDSWFAVPGNEKAVCIPISHFDDPIMNDVWNVFEEKKDLFQATYSKEVKDNYFTYLYTHTAFKRTPEERKKMIMAAGTYNLSVVFANNTAISIHNYSDKKLSDADHEILKRFVKVFYQSYTRFLDLQKAETQAREAQIEAALERVRSRSMAMHKSDELKEVIKLVLEQFVHLKINAEHAGFYIDYKAQDDMHIWLADPNLEPFFAVLPYFDTPTWNSFVEAKTKGTAFHTDLLDFEEKNKFYNSLFELFKVPEEAKNFYLQCKGLAVSTVLLDNVGLYIENFSGIPYSDEENKILMRFGKVFQQTYTRFLDLQKAEQQTLQAQQDLMEIKNARKKAEDALTELQATQKQLIQSEKMASLGELTAGIAHEIQNPLNFVNNFSEVSIELTKEMVDEVDKGNTNEVKSIANDLVQNLEKINHHGKRAGEIVKGMLQHSRSSSGQKELTDINALCDEYLRLAYHGLRAKDKSFNAKFETAFDNSIEKINVVPQDIGRVILNLITNAFYAVNEKNTLRQAQGDKSYEPTVTVSTKKDGDKILIAVADNGNGIPETIKEKIFQPFFTTKPTGQGTGLGLSLSYDIIKAHGGELKVETKESEGAKFIIQLQSKEVIDL